MRGKIVKGIAGFYYVRVADIGCAAETALTKDVMMDCCTAADTGEGQIRQSAIYECKAKGVFRKDNRKPLVGDEVEMDELDAGKCLGNIRELLPRRSELIRPAVANIDQALVIFSVTEPKPSFNLLDRFLIMMEQQGMNCLICFNKQDLDVGQELEHYLRIYRACGYQAFGVSAQQGEGIEELKALLAGKTTTVAGPSGVGKSSIINCLQSGVVMETGQISEKTRRGKHTTRHSELITIGKGTYILDTPGFSSLELFDMEKEQLAGYYPEFAEYGKYCKFSGCAHIGEKVCGVKDAVAAGDISKMRYENYCTLYEELKRKAR